MTFEWINEDEGDDTFVSLFDGNRDAIGLEEGGCLRVTPKEWEAYILAGHLEGISNPAGVYPIRDNQAIWGCVDFDEGEEASWGYAKNLSVCLGTLGIDAFIERSRSKGYHVWVFCQQWVPARTMRLALLAACQIVEVPTKEINPKQETLEPDQLGNYVRLPYPNRTVHNGRRCIVDYDRNPLAFQVALPMMWEGRCLPEQLEDAAALYVAPQPIVFVPKGNYNGGIPALAKHIAEHGPNSDRSTAMWSMAREMVDGGMEFDDIVAEILEADRQWAVMLNKEPKFANRKDGVKQVQHIVRKAST